MNTIRINVTSSPRAFELKDELEHAGLEWDRDYVWRYNPSKANWDYSNHQSAWVEFTFTDAATATYYRLKWA